MLNRSITKKREFNEFSKLVYEKLVPEDHFFYKVNELVDFSFVNDLCKGLYSKDMGRPAYPPEQIFRGSIVQFYFDLSDRKIEQEITYNIVAKWFIGLEVEDKSFDHTTISKFRTMLGKKAFDKIFYKILEKIKEAGCISEDDILLADATHIIADVAVPTVSELIRQGSRKVLDTLKKIDPEIESKVKLETIYQKIMSRNESKKQLMLIIKDAKILMAEAELKLSDSSVSQELKTELRASIELLCKLLRENVKEVQEKGKATFVIERQVDKTASIVDQDARNGVKSAGEGFCGYKANVNITQDMFILNAQLEKGNSDESHSLIPMIDQNEKHGFRTNKAIGDGKYGTYSNLEECKKRGIQLITSPRWARGPGGKEKFAPEDFIYDEKNNSLTCPAGISAYSSRKHVEDKRFYFTKATCINCPINEKCIQKRAGRIVQVSKYFQLNKELREYRLTEDYKKDRNMREKVEAKFGEMKNWHGLRRARYRGLKRVAIQLSLISIVVNLKRFVKMRWRPTAS